MKPSPLTLRTVVAGALLFTATEVNAEVIAGSLPNVPLLYNGEVRGANVAGYSTSSALLFTPSQSYNVQTVIVPSAPYIIGHTPGPFPTDWKFDVSLARDVDGVPGSFLGSVTGLSPDNPIGDFTSQSITLLGNQTYWLVLTPFSATSAAFIFGANYEPAVTIAGTSDPTGESGWYVSLGHHYAEAYQLIGIPTPATAVPEPTSVFLASPALAGLWFMRRNRAV